MKIISLSVTAFGKLKNLNLTFQDGINVISNVNGFGKTTLASFIRAMLYGFNYRTKDGVKDSNRFAPWGGNEKYGGSMVVEHDGETYRVERFFGSSAKNEIKTVVNVKTNKQADFGIEPGEYFLGLTAESYDRSAYFPQEAVELSTNDNFEAKLANLVENGGVDYDKVQKNLRDYRRTLKLEKGNGGKIFELEKQERELTLKLNASLSAERRSKEIDERLRQIEREKESLGVRQTEKKKRLDDVKRKLAQNSLTDAEKANLSKVRELEAEISRIPAEIESDKQICDDIVYKINHLRNDVRPKLYPNMRVLTVSALLIVLGIVLTFVLPQPAGYITGPIVAVLGIIGVIIAFVRKGAVTLVAGEKDALVTDYFNIARKYFYVDDKDFNEVVKTFWTVHSDYLADLRELETLRSIVKKPNADSRLLEEQANALESELSSVSRKFAELAGEEGRLTQEKTSLNFDSVSIQEQIVSVREQIRQAEFCYKVADTASALLAQAKDNLSSSYLPRLCARCQELLSFVTKRDYEVEIDRSFSVKLRENGQTKPMSEFSRGIREITLLCFRIALSELLYDGNIPFIIVDDAFVNFDENNFIRATDLLKKVAESAQVIYFTCHDRVGNLLK